MQGHCYFQHVLYILHNICVGGWFVCSCSWKHVFEGISDPKKAMKLESIKKKKSCFAVSVQTHTGECVYLRDVDWLTKLCG